jgi:hypothetical protein
VYIRSPQGGLDLVCTSSAPVISVLSALRLYMIKLLPDNSEINYSKGVAVTYRSMIQQQLSKTLRSEVAECLAETKGWGTNGNYNLTLSIEEQCSSDKYTKVLYMENEDTKISIHCQCKYSWKTTQNWQYGYAKDSYIWLLRKYVRRGCDFVAIVNRHFNQMILIPKSEIESSEATAISIINKINGKSKPEPMYLIPYFENESLEYFSRSYGADTSSWSKKNLDGSSIL